MKVNMSMIDSTEFPAVPEEEKVEEIIEDFGEPDEAEEDDEFDNSGSHSKLKTFLLVTAMLAGLGLFVWNMTGLVNNMRLDNQGSASSIVYGIQELGDFLGGSEGSSAEDAGDTQEGGASTDAIRDGPEESAESDTSESDDIKELKKELEETKNELALKEQENSIMKDYLETAYGSEDTGSE